MIWLTPEQDRFVRPDEVQSVIAVEAVGSYIPPATLNVASEPLRTITGRRAASLRLRRLSERFGTADWRDEIGLVGGTDSEGN